MCPKVLTCQVSSYDDFNREEDWLNVFKSKIENNEKIGEILKNENRQKVREQGASALITHSVNLLLYAVTNEKTDSARSIVDYVNGNIMECTFSACGSYFESDKYQRDAYRIIAFMKKEGILKDFLLNINSNDPFNSSIKKDIIEKLSMQNEETNQYLCEDAVIFSALVKKHKIDQRKFNCTITCAISLMLTLSVLMASITIGPIIYPGLSTLAILSQPLVILSLCVVLGFLLSSITASVWMHYAENNIPVEKMQQELDAEQSSQCTASSEEQKIEEQVPSTVLEIHLPNYSYSSHSSISDDDCMKVGLFCCFLSAINR